MKNSKRFGKADTSAFDFVSEMLDGNVSAGVDLFDRIMPDHPKLGDICMEFLRCSEEQFVTPHTSHPKYYWEKNYRKFVRQWDFVKRLRLTKKVTYYLINYASKNEKHEDEVRIMKVSNVHINRGITISKEWFVTRKQFQKWFLKLNKECLENWKW